MKAEIDAAIKAIVDDIAERQEALKALRKLGGYDTAPMNQPIPPAPPSRCGPKPLDVRSKKTAGKRGPYKKRKATPPAAAPTAPSPRAEKPVAASLPGEKPTTVGGAMKLFIVKHPKFTREQIGDWLGADAKFAKLLAQASPSAVAGNLAYWTNQGYLERAGDDYEVTAAGREWFGK